MNHNGGMAGNVHSSAICSSDRLYIYSKIFGPPQKYAVPPRNAQVKMLGIPHVWRWEVAYSAKEGLSKQWATSESNRETLGWRNWSLAMFARRWTKCWLPVLPHCIPYKQSYPWTWLVLILLVLCPHLPRWTLRYILTISSSFTKWLETVVTSDKQLYCQHYI